MKDEQKSGLQLAPGILRGALRLGLLLVIVMAPLPVLRTFFLGELLGQSLIQVANKIVIMFQTDRQAEQIVWGSRARPLALRHERDRLR